MFNLHIQLNGHILVEDRGALQPHTISRMSHNTQCRDSQLMQTQEIQSRDQNNSHDINPFEKKGTIII